MTAPFVRKMSIGEPDAQARTAPVVISTEFPVDRGHYTEILGHSPRDVDLSRVPLPLIVSHDQQRLPIGVVEGLHFDGPRLRGTARFGASPEADQALADVRARVLRSVSVGYQLLDEGTPVDKPANALRFRWMPIEVSVVSVPADPAAGFFRSLPSREPNMKVHPQDPQDPQDRAASGEFMSRSQRRAAAGVLQSERDRVADLQALGERFEHIGGRQLAAEMIRTGGTPAQLGEILLERSSSGSSITTVPAFAEAGMNRRELAEYSLVRALRCQVDPEFAARHRGLESEVSQHLARQLGRDPRGIFVPAEIFRRDLVAGTAGAGGNLVGTTHLDGAFVDVLRNRSVAAQLGVTMLPGLVGNVAVPTKTTGATTYWVTENNAPTEGAIAFGQLTMSPKSISGFVDFSRKLMLQSAPGVEMLVRNDLAAGVAAGIDAAVFAGAGTGAEPLGIFGSTAVSTSTMGAHGGAPSWDMLVELEALVAAANADAGNLAYLTNPHVRKKLRRTQLGTGLPMIWGDAVGPDGMSAVAGYRAAVTNAVPSNLTKGTSTACSAMAFGNWSDVLLGMWGGLDVLVDPYTGGKEGITRVVVFQDVDVAIRRGASFAVVKDLLTT